MAMLSRPGNKLIIELIIEAIPLTTGWAGDNEDAIITTLAQFDDLAKTMTAIATKMGKDHLGTLIIQWLACIHYRTLHGSNDQRCCNQRRGIVPDGRRHSMPRRQVGQSGRYVVRHPDDEQSTGLSRRCRIQEIQAHDDDDA